MHCDKVEPSFSVFFKLMEIIFFHLPPIADKTKSTHLEEIPLCLGNTCGEINNEKKPKKIKKCVEKNDKRNPPQKNMYY